MCLRSENIILKVKKFQNRIEKARAAKYSYTNSKIRQAVIAVTTKRTMKVTVRIDSPGFLLLFFIGISKNLCLPNCSHLEAVFYAFDSSSLVTFLAIFCACTIELPIDFLMQVYEWNLKGSTIQVSNPQLHVFSFVNGCDIGIFIFDTITYINIF